MREPELFDCQALGPWTLGTERYSDLPTETEAWDGYGAPREDDQTVHESSILDKLAILTKAVSGPSRPVGSGNPARAAKGLQVAGLQTGSWREEANGALVPGVGGFWSGRGALQHLFICGRPPRALGSLSGPSSPTTLMSWDQPSRPDVKSFTFFFSFLYDLDSPRIF